MASVKPGKITTPYVVEKTFISDTYTATARYDSDEKFSGITVHVRPSIASAGTSIFLDKEGITLIVDVLKYIDSE